MTGLRRQGAAARLSGCQAATREVASQAREPALAMPEVKAEGNAAAVSPGEGGACAEAPGGGGAAPQGPEEPAQTHRAGRGVAHAAQPQ